MGFLFISFKVLYKFIVFFGFRFFICKMGIILLGLDEIVIMCLVCG